MRRIRFPHREETDTLITALIGSQTVLAQIVQMVAEAQRRRAPTQRLADSVARWFVPAVLAIAMLTAVVWWFVGPEPRGVYAVLQ